MSKEKQIQIPETLFLMLCQKHIFENDSYDDAIEKALTDKITRMIEHNDYSIYKTAKTEEEREKARQRYLESKGIPKDFRW